MMTLVRASQKEKAPTGPLQPPGPSARLVTLSGRLTRVRPMQLAKAWPPMERTLAPIVRLDRLKQLLKAPVSMLVTLPGTVRLVSLEQLAKALAPMSVRLSDRIRLVRLGLNSKA